MNSKSDTLGSHKTWKYDSYPEESGPRGADVKMKKKIQETILRSGRQERKRSIAL